MVNRLASVLCRDALFALRSLRRRKSSSVVAVLALAVGISANTTVFSVVEAVLLRPLPFPESDDLVSVSTQYFRAQEGRWRDLNTSILDFQDWRANSRSFEGLAALGSPVDLALGLEGQVEPVVALRACFGS